MPGKWTVSGSSDPSGTSSSTSTTQTWPQVATSTLKLRAVLRKTRFPDDAAFQDIGAAVELVEFFAFGDDGTNAGCGVKAGDPCAARPHPFGKRALRNKVDVDFTPNKPLGQLGIAADI